MGAFVDGCVSSFVAGYFPTRPASLITRKNSTGATARERSRKKRNIVGSTSSASRPRLRNHPMDAFSGRGRIRILVDLHFH